MTTPAGWYPEPDGRQQRYWDGEKWTEHVAPLAGVDDTASTSADTTSTSTDAAGDTAVDGPPTMPLVTADADSSDGGSNSGKVVGGIAAVVLVAIAGFFAYTQFAAGSEGGADSPEAAVENLMTAFSDEDLVGVAETVLPGERRTYVDPYIEGIGHLQRWGVLADDLDTEDVAGFDFQVDGLELRSEEAADDIVNVYASGSLTAALEGGDLPIGDVLRSRMDADPSEMDEPAETTEFADFMVTTVEEDGRWYVSATYTVAETARGEAGMPMPSGIDPVGADSPEAAVDGFVDATTDLDLSGMIARLNPDEAAALQRYAPLFLDDAQAELDTLLTEEGLVLDVQLETEVLDERDDIAVVTFSSMTASIEVDGESAEMSFDGECTTITAEGETEEVCAEGGTGESPIDFTDTPAGDLTAMFDDMEEVGLVVALHDGEWYISPIRTYSEAILSVMRAIDAQEFDRIVTAIEDGSLEEWFEVELEALVDESFEGLIGEIEESDQWSEWEEDAGGTVDESADLDPLVDACESGDMASCDDLYWSSSIGSPEELVALTCGGTVAEGDQAGGNCATGEPVFSEGEAYGDDPELDALWDACDTGDMTACDDLFWSSGVGTEYESFAQTCGGRLNDETFGDCVSELGEQTP